MRKGVRGASEREDTWCSEKDADVVGIMSILVCDSCISMVKSQSFFWRMPRWNGNDAR